MRVATRSRRSIPRGARAPPQIPDLGVGPAWPRRRPRSGGPGTRAPRRRRRRRRTAAAKRFRLGSLPTITSRISGASRMIAVTYAANFELAPRPSAASWMNQGGRRRERSACRRRARRHAAEDGNLLLGRRRGDPGCQTLVDPGAAPKPASCNCSRAGCACRAASSTAPTRNVGRSASLPPQPASAAARRPQERRADALDRPSWPRFVDERDGELVPAGRDLGRLELHLGAAFRSRASRHHRDGVPARSRRRSRAR